MSVIGELDFCDIVSQCVSLTRTGRDRCRTKTKRVCLSCGAAICGNHVAWSQVPPYERCPFCAERKHDVDIKMLKGKFYPMVLKDTGAFAAEVRFNADSSVEFLNFVPDEQSKKLFELLGKEIGHEWRVKAGFEESESVYKPK